MIRVARADGFHSPEGHRSRQRIDRGGLPSPESENGARRQGLPRNLGDLSVSLRMRGLVHRTQRDRAEGSLTGCAAPRSETEQSATGTGPQGKTGATRDGRREVGAPHTTCEAGEPTQGTLRREEGRRDTEPLEGKMPERLSSDPVSTKLQRIAELARQSPGMVFTTLAHHIDTEFLREACRRTRTDGAVGVDGQTARDFAADLEANLQSLLDRFKSGRYRAPPVRRALIPKGDGQSVRPIGIPTFEDKALQRAVVMVLEAIYEQTFLDCSFGFRPGRSAHDALEVLWKGLMKMGGGWVLELDIRSFFDTLDKKHLRSFLDQRVRDGVIRRTIDKWLAAGVMDAGHITYPKAGTPQGGVISPLLANVYLHEVLDKWFEDVVKPRLQGDAFLIRYADDATIVFSCEQDARRVLAVLPKRFERYGLSLHPDKTQLLDFRRPPGRTRKDQGGPTSRRSTFDLLGFTHYWGLSRRNCWVVKRKTSKKSLRRSVRAVAVWCRRNRHEPLWRQQQALSRKLYGHFGYYGITGNARSLGRFLYAVVRAWRKWLARRSQRGLTWERFGHILRRYPLPPVRVVHSVYRRAAKPCT